MTMTMKTTADDVRSYLDEMCRTITPSGRQYLAEYAALLADQAKAVPVFDLIEQRFKGHVIRDGRHVGYESVCISLDEWRAIKSDQWAIAARAAGMVDAMRDANKAAPVVAPQGVVEIDAEELLNRYVHICIYHHSDEAPKSARVSAMRESLEAMGIKAAPSPAEGAV